MNNFLVKTASKMRGVPIENRELLFNSTYHKLHIYYNGLVPISAKADDFNIVENSKDEIALNKDVYVKETICNVTVSNRCIVVNATASSILIFTEYNKNDTHFGGLISFSSENSKELYELDFCDNGNHMLRGCSTNELRARFVKVHWSYWDFLGLQINSPEVHDIHIHGFGPLLDEPNIYERYMINDNITIQEV